LTEVGTAFCGGADALAPERRSTGGLTRWTRAGSHTLTDKRQSAITDQSQGGRRLAGRRVTDAKENGNTRIWDQTTYFEKSIRKRSFM
jgi:hypothetical protein